MLMPEMGIGCRLISAQPTGEMSASGLASRAVAASAASDRTSAWPTAALAAAVASGTSRFLRAASQGDRGAVGCEDGRAPEDRGHARSAAALVKDEGGGAGWDVVGRRASESGAERCGRVGICDEGAVELSQVDAAAYVIEVNGVRDENSSQGKVWVVGSICNFPSDDVAIKVYYCDTHPLVIVLRGPADTKEKTQHHRKDYDETDCRLDNVAGRSLYGIAYTRIKHGQTREFGLIGPIRTDNWICICSAQITGWL